MQAVQDEDHQGTTTSTHTVSTGVHEDPYRVTFTIPGWTAPFATTKEVASQCHFDDQEVGYSWSSVFVDELKLSHQAHLFIIQGGQLNRLFLASNMDVPGAYLGSPPYFLLNAKYPKVWEAPYFVRDVVLGKLGQLEDGMNLKEVISKMVSFHMKNGFNRTA